MHFLPNAIVYHRHAATLVAYCRKKFHIGYWKVAVHVAHPGALVRDSHTPPSQRLQMGLVGLIGLLWLGGLARRPLWRGAGLLAGLFAVTTLPFTVKALRRDPALGLLAPTLLLARAVALGVGFA